MGIDVDEAVREELGRYEATGEYLPGTADRLFAQCRMGLSPDSATPIRVAERVATVLGTALGQGLRNPEHAAPEGESPARAVLRRYKDLVRDEQGRLDRIAAGVAGPGGFPGGAKLTARVLEAIHDRRNAEFTRVEPPLAAGQARLAEVLTAHGFAPDMDVHAAARDWGVELAGRSEDQVVRAVARRMTIPAIAAKYGHGGKALAADDPRLKGLGPRREWPEGRTQPRSRI